MTQIENILQNVRELHELLFEPPYRKPIIDVRQPLLATPYTKPEMKPAYLAELLTIAEGKKGQKPETESLIRRDKNARVPQIIANGEKLLNDAIDVISHIYGASPRSMGLLPLLYYYNKQGIYVRSLLYGVIYWLNHGTENEITSRKFLFTIHREAFETVLRDYKERIIRRIGRKIGSGPEVTYPTARYFNGLLKLLIEHDDKIESEGFKAAHKKLIVTLGKEDSDDDLELKEEEESSSRTFRGGDRDAVAIRDFIDHAPKCEICGGRYYPGQFIQVDHIKQHSEGGKTTLENARNTHPFCNNRRKDIEAIKSGQNTISLPSFDNQEGARVGEQLTFLEFFREAEEELANQTDEGSPEDSDELENSQG